MKYIYFLFSISLLFLGCAKKVKHPALITRQEQTIVYFYKDSSNKTFINLYSLTKDSSYNLAVFNNEQVAAVSFSKDNSVGYIVAYKTTDEATDFSLIRGLKIYRLTKENPKPQLVKEIGDAIQIFINRTSSDDFNLIVHQVDQFYTNHILKLNIIFNNFGKEVLSEKIVFDLAKEGLPAPPEKVIHVTSKDTAYSLFFTDKQKTVVAIKDSIKHQKYVLTNIQGEFQEAQWSNENLFVVFSSYDKSLSNNKHTLYLCDIPKYSIMNTIKLNSLKDFFICGNYLIYQTMSKNKEVVVIYNLSENKLVKHIEGSI